MSPEPPENRTPVLIVSCSTLLFNAVLAITFHTWGKALLGVEDTEDFDSTEAWSIGVRAIVYAAGRYCLLNVGFAGCGLIGTLVRNTQMLRVFALGSLVDCTAILFILVAFLIFTLSPSLSGPFADLVCSEITRGESFGLTSYLREKETKWGIRGLDIVLWGRETCEENWSVGVLTVFLGFMVLAFVRVYTTWITWDLYLKVERTGRKYWVDLEAEQGEKMREMMTEGSKRRSRSHTLPATMASHGRFKSHLIPGLPPYSQSDTDAQGRPRLVLVPVFFDPTAPPQPSSAPAYASRSPRSTSLSPSLPSSSSSSSPSPSTSSHRNNSHRSHHSRRQSIPTSPSSTSSPPPSISSTTTTSHSTTSRQSRTTNPSTNNQYRPSPSSSASSSDESKSSSSYFDYFHHHENASSPVYMTGTGTGTNMKRSRSRSENSVLLGNWSTTTIDEGLMISLEEREEVKRS